MATQTKLIFGIRTSEPVSLTLTADAPLSRKPPDLLIKTSKQEIAIPYSNNAWVTTLDAGDHIAYMPAPGDSWFETPLTFTLSTPATIVSCKGAAKEPLAWTATVGTASDPKDPWPPPLDSNDPAPLANPAWLGSTLTTMKSQVSLDRSAPPHAPPAGTPGSGRPR